MSQDSFSLSHALPGIGGVLLAAGRGQRFDPSGQRHKLLARLGSGQTLVRTSAQQLLSWVDSLTVVVGVHNVGLVRELADLPLRVVVCETADLGPGATLRCGLQASLQAHVHPPLQGLLVCLADMPFIAPTTYEKLRSPLLSAAGESTQQAWRAQYQGQPGHPVALTAALARHFLALPAVPETMGKGLAQLWRRQPESLVEVAVDDPGCVRDIDTPEDLL